MSEKAFPDLLKCIDTTDRQDRIDFDSEIQDLLCFDALTQFNELPSLEPIFSLLVWYDTKGENSLSLIKSQKRQHPNWEIPFFNDSYLTDISFSSIIQAGLVHVGTSSVPNLLIASENSNPEVRNVVESVLSALNKSSITDILNEANPIILQKIIVSLGEIRKVEAVIPLLELADNDPSVRDAVDRSILLMGNSAVPYLVAAFYHPKLAVSNHAEKILSEERYEVFPEIKQTLKDQGHTTRVVSPEVAISILRDTADSEIESQIEALYVLGLTQFRSGKCGEASKTMEKMLSIRDVTPHSMEVAQVFLCQAHNLSELGEFQSAISLGLWAESLDPKNEVIREDLANWFFIQGQEDFVAKRWEDAAMKLRSAQKRSFSKEAQKILFYIIIRQNLIYILISMTFVLLFTIILIYRYYKSILAGKICVVVISD